MNLSLKRVTKYFALTLVCFALMAGLGTQAYAATANASTNLQVVVGAAANISVVTASPTTFSLSSTDFLGSYTGATQIQFGLRTTSGGTGTITVQGTANFTGAGAGSGPSLNNADLNYACSVGDFVPGTPNVLTGALVYCTGASAKTKLTPTNVLAGIGALSKTNNAKLTLNWTIPDNAAWDADTYTGTIQFTVTAT